VLAAALGWTVRVARTSGWERAWIAEAIGLVVLLQGVAALPPSAAETHVALAGALATTRRLLDGAAWGTAAPATRAAWERDRPLLDVASTVRAARHEAAWRALTEGSP
jgi:acyl-CoA dehydrogenase